MKIAIDISPIVYGTGVSVYTSELVRNLLMIDTQNEYILFGGSLRRRKEIKEFVQSLAGNYKPRIYPIAPSMADLIWNKMNILPIERFVGKIDVFHSSDWTQPPSNAYKVTTIHDLVPILYPEWSDPKIVKVHKRRLAKVKKEVDSIIVPSKQTKLDLMKLGFLASRIHVIHEAVGDDIRKADKGMITKVKQDYGINGKYLVAVGINPRKNTQNIIHAYEKIRQVSSFKDMKLVLIGHPYIDLNLSEGIIVTGHVDQDNLLALYSGAEAMVYPSFYEGFGLPILEAMKIGIPVVTSFLGSTKEVAGDAAILVDPNDLESIEKGIVEAVRNKEKLIESGKKREKEFSWRKNAEATLEIYHKACDYK